LTIDTRPRGGWEPRIRPSPPRLLLAAGIVLGIALLPPPAAADQPASVFEKKRPVSNYFGRLTLGIGGGFQYWTLASLEDLQDHRGALLAEDDFTFDSSEYEATYGYMVEIQYRLSRGWLIRALTEWTRLSWDRRDRQYIGILGGRVRTPVSISYATEIRTRPLLFTVGAGRALFYREVRLVFLGGLLIAPLGAEDEILVRIGDTAVEEVSTHDSRGVGLGFEGGAELDWVTDTQMTLYLEAFFRAGSTTLDATEATVENEFFPGSRDIDLMGFGLRVGLRWI
jgi:hypothetical protein